MEEKIKILALFLCIVGTLTITLSMLYFKYLDKEGKQKGYVEIAILQGIFIIFYGLVMYFYLPSENIRVILIILFIFAQTLILLYRRNTVDWLTTRIVAIKRAICSKLHLGETKVDTVYWMFTILIILILLLFSVPFWIVPEYPHNYISSMAFISGILLYIRSFLFYSNENTICLYDFFVGLSFVLLGAIQHYYLTYSYDNEFTAWHGKMMIAVILCILKREPPKEEQDI